GGAGEDGATAAHGVGYRPIRVALPAENPLARRENRQRGGTAALARSGARPGGPRRLSAHPRVGRFDAGRRGVGTEQGGGGLPRLASGGFASGPCGCEYLPAEDTPAEL